MKKCDKDYINKLSMAAVLLFKEGKMVRKETKHDREGELRRRNENMKSLVSLWSTRMQTAAFHQFLF